jgi:alkanesulfonate monooxygenase SsuD/methylene tetrahydromethanopterin reductase-like flavin-dependent oxidoreductase (luciferase family)
MLCALGSTCDFSRFGEPTSLQARSARYDEGLEVVRAVWSGQPFHHDGPQYQVDLGNGAPDPHPMPLWVASSTGHPHVIGWAAACDGIVPNPGERALVPDDIADLLAALHRAGSG